MLLLPLGLVPEWTTLSDRAACRLYYGPATHDIPENSLHIHLDPETVTFFERREKLSAEKIPWMEHASEKWPVLFGSSASPDLIASTFYWLSGWHEYTTTERDRHGRFSHEVSLQAKLGTITRPAVDAYREILAERLVAIGVKLHKRSWGEAGWALCPTHDIDYLKKWRPGMIYREVVLYFLRNQRRVSRRERVRRLWQFLRYWMRPGDVYRQAFERMSQEIIRRGGTATYLLKTGAHGPHDVFYDHEDAYLQERVAELEQAGFEIGLHPSYHAHTHAAYLRQERERLARITTQTPFSIRQHYLRHEVPQTSRLHDSAGFRLDSTLGFAGHEGFRHATCQPFQLYDISGNAPLGVWEMPLAVMEAALFNRRFLDSDAAREVTQAIMQTCRRFGGVAVMLWHNVLWDELDHPGWGQHFVETLDFAVESGARIASMQEAFELWCGKEMIISAR